MLKRIMISAFFAVIIAMPLATWSSDKLVNFRVLSPKLALKAAQATLQACRKKSYQVSVAVVDRGGNVQVILRDRYAGPHTPDTAQRKAYTAVTFRSDSIDLVGPTRTGRAQAGVRHIPGVLMLGGGVLIDADGSTVGAIGVSGAPTGKADHDCGKAGVNAIVADLL